MRALLCILAFLLVPAPAYGDFLFTLNGEVYADCNCNEQRDADELGLRNRHMVLSYRHDGGDVTQETFTDNNGDYSVLIGPVDGPTVDLVIGFDDETDFCPDVSGASVLSLDVSSGAQVTADIAGHDGVRCRGEGACRGQDDGFQVGEVSCGEGDCIETLPVLCRFGHEEIPVCEGLNGTACNLVRDGCVVNDDLGVTCPDKCTVHDVCRRGICTAETFVQCTTPACATGGCQPHSGECKFELDRTCLDSQLAITLSHVHRDCRVARSEYCYHIAHYFVNDYANVEDVFLDNAITPHSVEGRPDSCDHPAIVQGTTVHWDDCDSVEPEGLTDGSVLEEWDFCVFFEGLRLPSNSPGSSLKWVVDDDENTEFSVAVEGPGVDQPDACADSVLSGFVITLPQEKRAVEDHDEHEAEEILDAIIEVLSLAATSVQIESFAEAADGVLTVIVRFFYDNGPTVAEDRTAAALAAAFESSLMQSQRDMFGDIWVGTILQFASIPDIDLSDLGLASPGEGGQVTPVGEIPQPTLIPVVPGPEQLTPIPTATPSLRTPPSPISPGSSSSSTASACGWSLVVALLCGFIALVRM